MATAHAAIPVEELPKPTVPATSIERQENNPAKAAIVAKEALKKDQALDADASAVDAATLESQRLVASVSEALRKDARTTHLAVEVRVDGSGIVTLNGTVPTRQGSAAVESVAAKAVAPRRVQNNLAVAAR